MDAQCGLADVLQQVLLYRMARLCWCARGRGRWGFPDHLETVVLTFMSIEEVSDLACVGAYLSVQASGTCAAPAQSMHPTFPASRIGPPFPACRAEPCPAQPFRSLPLSHSLSRGSTHATLDTQMPPTPRSAGLHSAKDGERLLRFFPQRTLVKPSQGKPSSRPGLLSANRRLVHPPIVSILHTLPQNHYETLRALRSMNLASPSTRIPTRSLLANPRSRTSRRPLQGVPSASAAIRHPSADSYADDLELQKRGPPDGDGREEGGTGPGDGHGSPSSLSETEESGQRQRQRRKEHNNLASKAWMILKTQMKYLGPGITMSVAYCDP